MRKLVLVVDNSESLQRYLSGFFFLLFGFAVHAQVPVIYGITKLDSSVNTSKYDEVSPVLSRNGKWLYFTRTGSPDFVKTLYDRKKDLSQSLASSDYDDRLRSIYSSIARQDIEEPVSSVYNQDIWIARLKENKVVEVSHPGYPLNNALPNSAVSTGPEANSLVIINQFFEDGSMYEGFSIISRNQDGQFSFPRPLFMYDFYNLSGDVNLSMTSDGIIMILSLQRDDSEGQNDLYLSFHIKDDLWSAPQHIDGPLNSEFHESSPYISADRRYLYFSSDRPGSLGGADIWVSERLDYTWLNWSEPVRLPEPINSGADDSQGYISPDGKRLYFSSKRDGSSDIFAAVLDPPPTLPKELDLICTVVDGRTGKPMRGEIFWGPQSAEGYLEYFHTYTGRMETRFSEPEVYKFMARKPGYETTYLLFDAMTAAKQDLPVYFVVLRMYPKEPHVEISEAAADTTVSARLAVLEEGETLSFYNIYFAQSKAEVLPQSNKALNELAEGLRQNPSVKIRVEGHTDNVGNELDLMDLSWRRAESIKNYLVTAGISSERISTIGFGDQRPLSDNTSEDGRRKNRRVEIRVTARL